MITVTDTNVARITYYNEAGYVIKEVKTSELTFRKFKLRRDVDVTGNSGTGIVCEGIQFSDGACVIRWNKETNAMGVSSCVIYDCIEDVVKVHGHNGSTVIIWED